MMNPNSVPAAYDQASKIMPTLNTGIAPGRNGRKGSSLRALSNCVSERGDGSHVD